MPDPSVNANGTLYFTAYAGASRQLWRSDGTDEGTIQLTDVLLATGVYPTIRNITCVGSDVFFVMYESTGYALWKSDGTADGTKGVKSLPSSDYGPVNLTAWKGDLFFSLEGRFRGAKLKLWRSDGTEAGTAEAMPSANDAAIAVGDVYPIAVINDELLIVADTVHYGIELWTSKVAPSNPSGDYDASGSVDGADFLAWQRGFGGSATPAGSGADGDGSGAIDSGDLSVWAEHFGEGSAGGALVDAAVALAVSMATPEAGELGAGVGEGSAKPQAAAREDLIALAQATVGEDASRSDGDAARALGRVDHVAENRPLRCAAADLDAAFAELPRGMHGMRRVREVETATRDGDVEGAPELGQSFRRSVGDELTATSALVGEL